MRTSSGPRRRGFILPTTMMVVVLLTVMLAAAFALASAEFRVTDNAFASSRSLALAQAGLQNYFAAGHNLLGLTKDSTVFPFRNGYAVVVAHQLRDSTTTAPKQPALWVVQSIGYDTVRAPAGQPNGQRAVGQFSTLQPGYLPARAAMVSLNGVNLTGSGTNPISGMNTNFLPSTYNPACTPPSSRDTTGLTVGAATDYHGGSGGSDVTRGIEYLGSGAAVGDSTRIDWASLVGGQFTPDLVGAYPPAGNNTYQSYFFSGNATIPPGSRRGLLVVTGDVSFSSGTHWDGVIVAGGSVDFGTGYVVHGMVISGLNGTTHNNQARRGSGSIRWDYCYANTSIGSLMSLVPIKNAWVDTWSTY